MGGDKIVQAPSVIQWIPLISVVIGSIIAYYGIRINEENRRSFELKKEAYFDFLDVLREGTMAYTAKKVIERQRTVEELEQDMNVEKNVRGSIINNILWMHNYNKALIMIELCGSKKVNNLVAQDIDTMLKEYPTNSDRYNEFEFNLINAMREDLKGTNIINRIQSAKDKRWRKLIGSVLPCL